MVSIRRPMWSAPRHCMPFPSSQSPRRTSSRPRIVFHSEHTPRRSGRGAGGVYPVNIIDGQAPPAIEQALAPRLGQIRRTLAGLALIVLPGVALLAVAVGGSALRLWQLD